MIKLEEVLSPENMQTACRRVIANKGAPGVDGMTINEVRAHFEKHGASICAHIREGRYIPAAVKRVDIPKPSGGTRMLGIPTVQDRVIQQAIEQTQKYIAEGRTWVVELDLAKFFDTVNHNRLMSKLGQHIEDKMLLRLIRRYLRTGIMSDGVVQVREEGTPQGSPLSPILSLIVLDELDKYLDKRGLKYCRFADDCNCYAKSRKAAERTLENMISFIEGTLKLRVNRDKSGVFRPSKAKFLGYTFVGTTGAARVHAKSFQRLRDKLKEIFFRARGTSLLKTIAKLNMVLRGWRNYFRLDERKGIFEALDIHIRRHLRKLIWIAWKKPKTRERNLVKRGLDPVQAWKSSVNGRGAWWNAGALHMLYAFDNRFFQKMGLYSLLTQA